jgi:hypothetical protein
MLRLSKLLLTGAGAAALLMSASALAQAGLGQRLDAQEQQLAQAENSCGPVNLAEYANLLHEAAQNKARAEKMKKKGVPVDETQVNADLAKAMSLFARAQAAQARNCMLQAQQQAQTPQSSAYKGRYNEAQVGGNSPVSNPADIFSIYQGPAGQGVNFAPGLDNYAQQILNAHNAVRQKIGSPPMQWDPKLEQYGLARSQELAHGNGELVHASREGRKDIRENILKAPVSYSIADQMKLWTGEIVDFVPGTFPNVCHSGGGCGGVLHLTQMAWPTSLYVGCGSTVAGGFVYTACGYYKGANQDGKEIGTEAASAAGYEAFSGTFAEVGSVKIPLSGVRPQSDQNVAAADNGKPIISVNRDGYSQQYVGVELEADKKFSQNAQFKSAATAGPGLPDDFSDHFDAGGTDLAWGADVDLVNKYIWRGFILNDQPALQPNIWTSAYGFAASAWFQVAVNQLSDPLGLDIDEDEPICRYHRLEPGISASYDLGSNALHKQNYIYPLVDSLADEGTMNDRLWFWGSGNYQKIEGSDDAPVNTAVQPPDLNGLPPAYDPAAPRPYDPDCVM